MAGPAPEPMLYLFDGFNLLHAGCFADVREVIDTLAGFVAIKGARGVLVFDGVGQDAVHGALEVRFVPHADTLLERLAADRRAHERVLLVTSDATLATAAGREVARLSSKTFLSDLEAPQQPPAVPGDLGSKLDPETRRRLERLRRGE